MDYLAAGLLFTAGLTSSWHCIGMCGGFPVMLANGQRSAGRQLLYNFARVNTLVVIGALSGAVGASIVHLGPLPLVERGLPVVAGVLMLIVGAEMLGLFGASRVVSRFGLPRSFGDALRAVLRSRTMAAPIALGVFNAFLPCHLVYAFAARAASSGSVVGGMETMLFFGLGTVPALFLTGHLGGRMPAFLSPLLARASGAAVLLFGIWTISRAFMAGGTDASCHGV
jgi:sulfite exporter TauE/SafE